MRSNIKGGSKASDLVMSTNPVLCGDESPVLLGKQFDFDPTQLTIYNTTGGARKSRKNKNKNKSFKNKNKSFRKKSKSKNNRKKSKSFRKKKGGSKASNAVLKGSPCNANNLVGGATYTNNAFVQNNCRGKSQSGGSSASGSSARRSSARGSASVRGSIAPILKVDLNAVVPHIYNDRKLYKTIFAPDYPNLCHKKIKELNTPIKAKQRLSCYINFFEILYLNIAKLYYLEAAHEGDISVSQSVLNYFNNTDILNVKPKGYYLNEYNTILSVLLPTDIQFRPEYDTSYTNTQINTLQKIKVKTTKQNKKFSSLKAEKELIDLQISRGTEMLRNMKEIISNYYTKTWKPLSGEIQTTFKFHINDLIINGLDK